MYEWPNRIRYITNPEGTFSTPFLGRALRLSSWECDAIMNRFKYSVMGYSVVKYDDALILDVLEDGII
jgi:hypothetical protein